MTKNIFTETDWSKLTQEQREGVEKGIYEVIKMDGQMTLTGKASMVLWQIADCMTYDGKITREMHDDRHIFRLA